MKWSKLKKTIENNFAVSVSGRVNIFVTRYTSGSFFMVRGWITIDKAEIANFSTSDNFRKFEWDTPDIDKRIPAEERTEGNAVEKGEFSRADFLDACREFSSMKIDEALKSDNPVIRSFAMLDRRLGKRRLKLIDSENLHPLVLKCLNFRLECESIF
ncbi:MAG: hypothetical protein IPM38_16565 [Ignavibacteria bacterium]|nr:hypothetical protein [Ignavibacteria bacterium]